MSITATALAVCDVLIDQYPEYLDIDEINKNGRDSLFQAIKKGLIEAETRKDE